MVNESGWNMRRTNVVLKTTFTPLTGCNAICSNRDCQAEVEFTIAGWEEDEHGPIEEPVVYHTCRVHISDLIDLMQKSVYQTVLHQSDIYFGRSNEK